MVNDVIKISAPATRQFWELPILFEDDGILALDKPADILVSPDRFNPERPSLLALLHQDIGREAAWVKKRPGLVYLMNVYRLDLETTGIILFAKNRPTLLSLADQFGSEKALRTYTALVRGSMHQDEFEITGKISPHPLKLGFMRIDERNGKKAQTDFIVQERFKGFSILACKPRTSRTHQVRVHLQHLGLPILGDPAYGGPELLLSNLKRDYHLKPKKIERPLISTLALHLEKLVFRHPNREEDITIEAPWPKDLKVAVKYLRLHAALV